MNAREMLDEVEQIARGAGEIIRNHYRKVERLTKTHAVASNEAVTQADRDSQRYIVAELRERFPTDGVIGEESDDGAGITLDVRDPLGRNWVIDPIDGTNNFISGLGGFCVCIGLIEKGMPVLGVTYDVLADRVYRAATGLGATVDGVPVKIGGSGMSDSSILCMTANLVGKDGRTPGWAIKLLGQITWKVRVLGSAALEAVLAGEGVASAAIQVNTKLWDIASAAAFVVEAGGEVVDFAGEPVFPIDLSKYQGDKVPYVAGSARAVRDVLDFMRSNP